MASPFRYVVTDMDGTLLSTNHFVSDYTRDTLKTLVLQHGMTPILATGRSYADIRVVGDNLRKYIWGDSTATADELSVPQMYFLTSNGAVVHNGVTGELVFQTCVDPALAEKILTFLEPEEEIVNTNAYQYDDWVCRIDWPEMLAVHKESGLRYIHVPHPAPSSAAAAVNTGEDAATASPRGIAVGRYDGISKIFFIADDASRLPPVAEEVHAIVAAHGGAPVSLTFSASDCMDVMADGVTKGHALEKLFGIILPRQGDDGVDVVADALRHSIAFGDGLNDAEMLTMCGKGCVMGNANPKLKAQHPELEVVLSNAEDGVAKKLRSVFALPE